MSGDTRCWCTRGCTLTLFPGPRGRLCDVCVSVGHTARNPIDLCGAKNKRATCYRDGGHEGNHVSSTGREWTG